MRAAGGVGVSQRRATAPAAPEPIDSQDLAEIREPVR
jgi:hypothetical protein